MQASRRWRDWKPPEKIQDSHTHELTKLTETQPERVLSVLSVDSLAGAKRNAPSASVPEHDPEEWRKPFARWLAVACMRSARCSGGVGCLHLEYCNWEVRQGGVPCTRNTFELLLKEHGIQLAIVVGVAMVSGLAFLEDFMAAGGMGVKSI